jgi:hypothetical protein
MVNPLEKTVLDGCGPVFRIPGVDVNNRCTGGLLADPRFNDLTLCDRHMEGHLACGERACGRHRNDKFFHVTIDHVCLGIDIQYAVNVKTDVDGSDPIETERLEDLRLG